MNVDTAIFKYPTFNIAYIYELGAINLQLLNLKDNL